MLLFIPTPSMVSSGRGKFMKKVLLTAILAISTFIASAEKNVTLIGYIPEYRISLIDKMNLGAFTHVIAAFANPDSNGTMSCSIDLETFSQKVRAAGSKPVISIGGGGSYSWGDDIGVYHHLYADTNRTDFIIKLADYCELYHCAGIDLDIEGNALSHAGYDAFASELADTLHARGLEIYGVYGVGGQWSAVNASDETLQKMDFIGTMSYGGVGQWNWSKPTNQCTYERFKSDIEYFVDRGVDPSKIHGGIPFYSVGFPAESTSNLSPYVHTLDQLMSSTFYTDQDAFHVDTMINKDNKPEFFSGYNTNKRKIDFCDSLGAGIMIWEIGQDNYSGAGPNMIDSLVTYIKSSTATNTISNISTAHNSFYVKAFGSSIKLNLTEAGNYSLHVINIQGRSVFKLKSRNLVKGVNLIPITPDHMSKGIYTISITENESKKRFNGKLLIK